MDRGKGGGELKMLSLPIPGGGKGFDCSVKRWNENQCVKVIRKHFGLNPK